MSLPLALAIVAIALGWARPALATHEVHISLQSMGAYGGDSVQHGEMNEEAQPGPTTLWSAVDERYFAVYFAPSTVKIDGQMVVVTIADSTGSASGLPWNGGNLEYSTSSHAWTVGSKGSYLRVWQNYHDQCMYHPYPQLKHSKGEELTCTRCDSDMDMVTGLSKTTPAGADGRILAVDSSRYSVSGPDIVLVADDEPSQLRGSLDEASCSTVAGWAQDESAPTTAVDAEIDFNGATGATGTTAFRLLASVSRSDLCSAIGSCDHAFSMSTPRGVMDGAAHKVYAYAINATAGAANALLTSAPKTVTCKAPAIPSGDVKRHVANEAILTDWRFNTLVDEAPYDAAELAAVADGPDLASAPRVVQLSGQPAIYVVDGAYRRHIINPASMAAWRLTSTDVTPITATALAALTQGPDWPVAPLLVKAPSSASTYLLDVPFGARDAGSPDAAPDAGEAVVRADAGRPARTRASDASSEAAPESAADPQDTTGVSPGSGCSVARTSQPSYSGWLAMVTAGVIVGARRRQRSRSSASGARRGVATPAREW